MSRKESTFYVIIFINSRIVSFKRKTHFQKLNKEVKGTLVDLKIPLHVHVRIKILP